MLLQKLLFWNKTGGSPYLFRGRNNLNTGMIIITRTCFETFLTIGSFSTLEKRKSLTFQEIKTNCVSLQTWQMPTLIFPAWATCKLIGSWKRYEIRHHLERNDCPELPFKLESLANGYYYKHFWWMNFSTIWYQIRWIWPGTRKRVSIHSPSDTHRSVNCVKSKHFQGTAEIDGLKVNAIMINISNWERLAQKSDEHNGSNLCLKG